MHIEFIAEGFKQKARQTVVVAFWEKMAAYLHCVADELLKANRASNMYSNKCLD